MISLEAGSHKLVNGILIGLDQYNEGIGFITSLLNQCRHLGNERDPTNPQLYVLRHISGGELLSTLGLR